MSPNEMSKTDRLEGSLEISPVEASTIIRCIGCNQLYPDQGVPYRCPDCGGLYDYVTWPIFDSSKVDPLAPRMWRYAHTFGLPEGAHRITLGEGSTPLVWSRAFDLEVAFKLEYMNPTGSFKDRGSAVMMSFLRSRNIRTAAEDSSGNAGASFAAYASSVGLRAKVFVPDYASGPKRSQIGAYGAEVIPISGPRSNAAQAVLEAAKKGEVYASHAYLPFTLPGFATVAYELFQEMGKVPGTIVVPVGQGGLLLGISRGFQSLQRAGLIEHFPRLIGVQARACAPLWAEFHFGKKGLDQVTEGESLAEGVRIRNPLRSHAILQMIKETGGVLVSVNEPDILPGRDALARLGFYVEPTSAIVWNAMEQLVGELADPVVVILTGSGLKAI